VKAGNIQQDRNIQQDLNVEQDRKVEQDLMAPEHPGAKASIPCQHIGVRPPSV